MNNQPTSCKVQQINQLRAQVRRWRLGSAVVTFGITAVCIAILYTSATKLAQPGATRDRFVAEYKTGLTTQVLPQAQQIAKRTWSELVPAVRTEVVQMRGRYPELADAVSHELQQLSLNLPARAEKVLRGTVGEMLEQRAATIQKLYGDITPQQLAQIRTVLQTEGERRAGNITEVLVKPFETTVQQIHADLQAIDASTPDDKTTAQSAAQLTTMLVQLTSEQLAASAAQLNHATQQPQKFAEAK